MSDSTSSWTVAQQRERHYHETRAASHGDHEQVYAEFHAPFWRGILERLTELEFHDGGYYLDVGCGPNPIVAFIDKGTRIGVDPLMPFYRENFVFPPDLEVHEGTIEELSPVADGSADVIFSMNNIDHIKDLGAAVKTLRRKIKEDGHLVISVNIVKSAWAAGLSKVVDIYKVVDPTHTYHFHSPQEVADQISDHFEMVRYENIDALAEEMAELKKSKDTEATSMKGRVRDGLKFLKNDMLLREDLFLLLFKPKPGT